MSKRTPLTPDFNYAGDSAPEYVEVILWHRVALAAVALILVLAAIGYGLSHLFKGADDGAPVIPSALSANQQLQQEPPAAIPSAMPAQADSVTEVAETGNSKTRTVAAPAPIMAASGNSTASTFAPVASTSATPDAATTLAMADTQTTAVLPATRQAASTGNVKTAIYMPAIIKRIVLTDSMRGREPGNAIEDTRVLAQRDNFSLHLFVEVHGRNGDTLTYQWLHNGKPSTKVKIPVRTSPWRGHVSKAFNPKLAGDWQVKVIDRRNVLLAQASFHLDN